MNLEELKKLSGITGKNIINTETGSNVSLTGMEKARLMKEHNIKPGTDAWFRLWFTRPYLTNTSPLDPKFKKD